LAAPSLCRQRLQWANLHNVLAKFGNWTIDIVKRIAAGRRFAVRPAPLGCRAHPGWASSQPALAKDFEATQPQLALRRLYIDIL
jgi:hypothetical protein